MKVLFVHDGPMMSNATKIIFYGVHYTNEIIERYSYFGNEITFLMRNKVMQDNESSQFTQLTHPAFRFIEVPNFKSILTKLRQKEAEEIIEKAVKEHHIIIVRLPSANGVIAKKIAEKLGKPVLVEVVACVFDALWNYDWRGKMLAKYKMKKYQAILHKASHVIYVTNEFLQSRYPTKGKSIGCSDVVLKDIDQTVLSNRLKKIENLQEELVLGTVAAIDVPYKGQADVIKAISILKKQNILVKYKIVGQGNPDKLQELIKKCNVEDLVEIVGPLKHDIIFSYLDEIDVYIQPSKTEGLPRAVVEALSRACPTIGSRVGGIPELIQEELLFNTESVNEIVTKIQKISNKDLQRKIAEENFEKAKEYQLEVIEKRRIDFYNQFKSDYNL